jgi:hypothetical protein
MVNSQRRQVERRHGVSNCVARALVHATSAQGREDPGCATHFARRLHEAVMKSLDIYRLIEIEIAERDDTMRGIIQTIGRVRLLAHASQRHQHDRKQCCPARNVTLGDHNALPKTRNTALWEITEMRGESRHDRTRLSSCGCHLDVGGLSIR